MQPFSLYGKYYEENRKGNLWHATQAPAGTVLPIWSNTTQQCGLFNPTGSNVVLVLATIDMTLVDTTGAAGGFCLSYKTGCGASIATGAAVITAATTVAAVPGRLGGGFPGGSQAIFMSAGITTAAPAVLKQLGLNQLVLTPATTGAMQWRTSIDLEGTVIIDPGTVIFLGGNIANLNKWVVSMTWIESRIT